jgi:hypothetical protein
VTILWFLRAASGKPDYNFLKNQFKLIIMDIHHTPCSIFGHTKEHLAAKLSLTWQFSTLSG